MASRRGLLPKPRHLTAAPRKVRTFVCSETRIPSRHPVPPESRTYRNRNIPTQPVTAAELNPTLTRPIGCRETLQLFSGRWDALRFVYRPPRSQPLPTLLYSRDHPPVNRFNDVAATVSSLASEAVSQTEFLTRLSHELLRTFPAAAVAAAHPAWPSARFWTADGRSARRFEASCFATLLGRSQHAPAATDVPLISTGSEPPQRSRCLHVRLDQDDARCAIAVVYRSEAVPNAAGQIHDLKRLAAFVEHGRTALAGFASYEPEKIHHELLGSDTSANFERALRRFHFDLDRRATAYRIANETRRITTFERVTVLLVRRGCWTVEAVSGAAVVDRRGNGVVAAETFAKRIAILGRPIGLPQTEPLPPQIDEALERYRDTTDVSSVVAVPLYRPIPTAANAPDAFATNHTTAKRLTEATTIDQAPIGLLLLENFFDGIGPQIDERTLDLGNEAAIALANAIEHHRIFGVRALKVFGDWFGGRKLPNTLVGLICAVALLLAAAWMKVDHHVIATGVAEPARQQHVFARADGIVKEVFVRDGDRVAAGDPLLRLENTDLETRAENVTGQIQTATRRLASIRSILLDPTTEPKQAGRLAIESRQLESELAGYQNRLDLIRKQLSELDVRSPIDGTVAGWQLHRKLFDRPVARGNQLVTLVDDQGPWQLRLQISDKDTAEVLAALHDAPPLRVEFAAASHPEATFHGKLESIGTAARRNGQGVNVVDALATITPDADPINERTLQRFAASEARVGVEATAKIACGKRAILSSWFGDVGDFFHRNVWFYLR